jgi:hypothetical protein
MHVSQRFALAPVPGLSIILIETLTSPDFTHGWAELRPTVHQPPLLDTPVLHKMLTWNTPSASTCPIYDIGSKKSSKWHNMLAPHALLKILQYLWIFVTQ